MSVKNEEKIADANNLETEENNETDAKGDSAQQKSRSAKRRAKKSQKKAEAVYEQNVNESEKPEDVKRTDTVSSDSTPEKKDNYPEVKKEVEEEDEAPKNNEPIEKPVPKIQRYDMNGKPLRNIAGNGAVHLGDITPHNVIQLKKLNEAVFPILYNDKFYVEARYCGELGRLAYYNDVVVGAVCCRIDDISDEKSLYIMTLGTLAAYRQIGIGTVLIDYVLKLCEKLEEIKTVYLHVQVNNMNAVHFYEKHGFTNDGIIEDYYRINPRDAFLLLKRIRE